MTPRSRIPSISATSHEAAHARSVPASVTGSPSHSFSQTPVLQRQPANEDPALRRRRLDAAVAARTAIDRLTQALDRGYLLQGEALTDDGRIESRDEARIESRSVREARLRQLIRDLRALVVDLEAGPVDPTWFEPRIELGRVNYNVDGPPVWKDTVALYLHRNHAAGGSLEEAFENTFSIQTAPIPTAAIRRSPVARATETGIYLIVPDPENAPLVYRRLTQYEGWQERGAIVTVWSDDFGYFYWGGEGRKNYLPGRP